MKNLILFFSSLTFFFSSCSTVYYYQAYDVKSENVKNTDDSFKFENEQIILSYNLWANRGDIGFYIFNKTDSTLYINLAESYYIVNGTAYDYFQNRSFERSYTNIAGQSTNESVYYYNLYGVPYYINSGVKTGSARSNSVSYHEKKIINIPPKTGKTISEFSIVSTLYRDCNLYRRPGRKDTKSVTFKKEESPLRFSNLITFDFSDKMESQQTVESKFWVSKVTNYSDREFVISKNDEFCGEKSFNHRSYFVYDREDRFYYRYTTEDYGFKH